MAEKGNRGKGHQMNQTTHKHLHEGPDYCNTNYFLLECVCKKLVVDDPNYLKFLFGKLKMDVEIFESGQKWELMW